MKVKLMTTYSGIDCHKQARHNIALAQQVFGATVVGDTECGGRWLVNRFPTTVNEPCTLGTRGVYVVAPGGMTTQFLNPTNESVVSVELFLDGCTPVHDAPPQGEAGNRIALDEDGDDTTTEAS